MNIKFLAVALMGSAGFLLLLKKNNAVVNVEPVAGESASNILNTLNIMTGDSVIDSLVIKKESKKVQLEYFEPDEFGGWFEQMSPELLRKLDKFRHEWGFPVEVSRHKDAVGREDAESQSQHNILMWGEVRAVDLFPKNSLGAYINTKTELKRAYDIARRVGFSGIGLYTDTNQGFMIHLDVRKSSFAKWSRVGGVYKGINEAIG
jgi:hypothetical protein